MWKLNKVGESILNQYVKEMLPSLVKRLEDKLTTDEIRILIPGYQTATEDRTGLIGLLKDEPEELWQRNNNLMAQFVVGYDERELADFQEAKRKKNNPNLVSKYNTILEKLQKAFDYDHSISQNKERAYRLTEMKDS